MNKFTDVKMNIEGEVADGVNATAILRVGNTNRVEEAYLTFDNIVDTLLGDLASGTEMFNFRTSFGKKAIQFGTEGNKYFNETQFINKSAVSRAITGAEITTGEGAEVSFDLPTPAPVNLSIGAFEDTNGATNLGTSRPLYTLRTTTELEVSNFTIDLGASALLPDNKNTALGVDAKLSMDSYSLELEVASQKNDTASETDQFYAATLGYEIKEDDIDLFDAYNADEIFITNSGIDIVPVVRVDDKPVGNKKPGILTNFLRDEFLKCIEEEL